MNFDRVAPHYSLLEAVAFGNGLQRARVAFIDQAVRSRSALLIGEGAGSFCAELVQINPQLAIDYVDSSSHMMKRAAARLCPPSQIQFFTEDFRTWEPPRSGYDLIVSHFFLDCFPEKTLAEIIAKGAALAANNAVWLVSDFNLPVERWSRLHARAWLTLMYLFFRCTTALEATKLVDPSPFLLGQGFQLQAERHWRLGLIRAQCWQRV